MSTLLNEELPMLSVKKKNIQAVIDYCLENDVEFTVKPKTFGNDEWKVELNITAVRKAVHLGMFLKEIKTELVGIPYVSPLQKEPKKIEVKETSKETIKEAKAKAAEIVLAEDNANIFAFETEAAL